jgi:hypothetical protein
MIPLVDISGFQLGVPPDEDADEEAPMLAALAEQASAYVESRPWAPPVGDMLLAFGVGKIIGLFLARFEYPIAVGECAGDRETWVVVGDLPPICVDTSETPTPEAALRLYCAICQDWADNVLAGASLAESYPIAAEPTAEHAQMLLSRIEFIRKKLVPLAKRRTKRAAKSQPRQG